MTMADDRPRDELGQYAPYAHGTPGEDTMQRKYHGSFLFPSRRDFSGDVDEYATFFENAEVDDETLRAAVDAYAEVREAALTAAWHRGAKACDQDPEMIEWSKKIGGPYLTDKQGLPVNEIGERVIVRTDWVFRPEWQERVDEWSARYRDEEAKKWPVRWIAPFDARTVLGVSQAIRSSRLLGSDEAEQRLLNRPVPVPVDGDPKSYDELWETFHVGEWLHKVLG